MIEEEQNGKPCYFDIKRYIEDKEYPREASDNDMVLLRCVDAREVEQMLVEVHEGSFGTHANEHAMARKILRAGYYWLTMENDCCIHVRKCHKCQAFEDNVNAPPVPLNVLAAP